MRLGEVDGGLGQDYGTADLIEAVRAAGVQPRDPRVKATGTFCGHVACSPGSLGAVAASTHVGAGPAAGNRPRTAARLDAALRSLGLVASGVPARPPRTRPLPSTQRPLLPRSLLSMAPSPPALPPRARRAICCTLATDALVWPAGSQQGQTRDHRSPVWRR